MTHEIFTGRRSMRKLTVFLAIYLFTAIPALAADRLIAPDWSLKTPDGETVQLSVAAQEQTTVLFFWATWCPYCKALMPHLQSMKLQYGDKLEILAINIFEDSDPAEFMRREGYDFTVLLDGDSVAEAYGVTATPGLFVIDRHREIRFNVRQLPRYPAEMNLENASNSRKAAVRAPYWAAEIRKAIDAVEDSSE